MLNFLYFLQYNELGQPIKWSNSQLDGDVSVEYTKSTYAVDGGLIKTWKHDKMLEKYTYENENGNKNVVVESIQFSDGSRWQFRYDKTDDVSYIEHFQNISKYIYYENKLKNHVSPYTTALLK